MLFQEELLLCVHQPMPEVAIALVTGVCCLWEGEQQGAESYSSFTGPGRPGPGRNSDDADVCSAPLNHCRDCSYCADGAVIAQSFVASCLCVAGSLSSPLTEALQRGSLESFVVIAPLVPSALFCTNGKLKRGISSCRACLCGCWKRKHDLRSSFLPRMQ